VDTTSKSSEVKYTSNIIAFALSWVLWSPITQATWIYFQLFLLELGASAVIIGLILSISTFIIGFARIIGGYLADYFGRKRIIVILTYAYSFTYLIYVYAPHWEYILIGSILMNIFLLYQPAISAIIADSLPKEKRGIGFAAINLLPSLVTVFSPYLALYMVIHYGLVSGMRILYMLAFLVGIIVGTIRLLMLKETLRIRHRKLKNDVINNFKLGYSEAISFLTHNLRPLAFIYLLLNLAYGIAILNQIYVVKYLGISKEGWGWISFIGGIVFFIATIPMGYLSDKIGRKKPITLSLCLGIISLYLYIIAPIGNAYTYILLAIMMGSLSWALGASAFPALEADVIPHELRGRIAALLALIASIAFGVGQLLSGYLYEFYSPRFPFMVALIIRIVSLLPLIWLRDIRTEH